MKKVMYMHMGSANHGCEALVRTSAKLFGGPENVILWSLAKDEDEYYGSASGVEKIVESEEIKKGSVAYFESLFRRKILKQSDANLKIFLRETFKQAIKLNEQIRKYCKFNVLWGCSIDEDAITKKMERDLEGYDLITAREQVTYKILKKINHNTVQVADPAFLLKKEECPLPEGFLINKTVGVNVSPLIMKYGTESNLILDNYEQLMEYIIQKTDMNICLIPHVVWEFNDDRKPCRYLYQRFVHTNRVAIVEDRNCEQLKYIISKCRFFVGARTHSTIAAYSTYVPTLVVGYSVKSRGIAKDLFGTSDNYVVPVQNLQTADELKIHFEWLIKHEKEQIEILKNRIPSYKKKAQDAIKMLEYLMNGR